MDPSASTKLILAVVDIRDARTLIQRLIARGFGATRLDAYGGFLRTERSLVLVATSELEAPAVAATIRETCPGRIETVAPAANDGTLGLAIDYGPEQVEIAGAIVLMMPIERVDYLGLPVPLAAATTG